MRSLENMGTARRVSYIFLSIVPLLNFAVLGVRALRLAGIYQTVGAAYFAAIAFAAWTLGARVVCGKAEKERKLALAGILLMAPSALMALLWVGLGPPWQATPMENRMRYLVLLIDSVAVTCGFVVMEQVLQEAGERFYSTLAGALAILGGAAYLVWNCIFLGLYVAKARGVQTPAAFVSLSDSFDALLFIACILTYSATLLFTICMRITGWLGRGATRSYVIVNLLLLILVLIKGLSYPDPTASSAPWYLDFAFIAGIPAMPWFIPYLFGVKLLSRAQLKCIGTTTA